MPSPTLEELTYFREFNQQATPGDFPNFNPRRRVVFLRAGSLQIQPAPLTSLEMLSDYHAICHLAGSSTDYSVSYLRVQESSGNFIHFDDCNRSYCIYIRP